MYPFPEPEPPRFLRLRLRLRLRADRFGGSGSGSGSDQNVSAPAAPAPAPAPAPHPWSKGVKARSCCISFDASRQGEHFKTYPGADPGGGRWGGHPPLGRKDPPPLLKCRKKGHCCLLNGCSTSFRHNMAINILKSCESVFAYVKNRSFPSHIRSSFPWRPPLAEILDPRLLPLVSISFRSKVISKNVH